MPVLKNPRHEAFAQALATAMRPGGYLPGGHATAYRQAGYAPSSDNAAAVGASTRLKKYKVILERVAELQEQERKRKGVTLESISGELEEARELARENAQAAAMVAASAQKAKLYGLEIKRVEQGKPGDFSAAANISDVAKQQLIEAGLSNPSSNDVQLARESMEGHLACIAAIVAANDAGSDQTISQGQSGLTH